jgi:hypothetical protein
MGSLKKPLLIMMVATSLITRTQFNKQWPASGKNLVLVHSQELILPETCHGYQKLKHQTIQWALDFNQEPWKHMICNSSAQPMYYL